MPFKSPQEVGSIYDQLQWDRFSVAVGQNLVGYMPPKGFTIGNVQIDNLSGSWLTVNPGGFIVQPYLVGWSTNLIPYATTVDILYTAGPTGFGSSTAGQPINVALYSERLGNEPGTAYIPLEATYQNVTSILTAINTITNTVILAVPPVGSSYRLYSLIATQTPGSNLQPFWDMNMLATFRQMPATTIVTSIAVSPEAPFGQISYPSGLQLPVDQGLSIDTIAGWGQGKMNVSVLYSVA